MSAVVAEEKTDMEITQPIIVTTDSMVIREQVSDRDDFSRASIDEMNSSLDRLMYMISDWFGGLEELLVGDCFGSEERTRRSNRRSRSRSTVLSNNNNNNTTNGDEPTPTRVPILEEHQPFDETYEKRFLNFILDADYEPNPPKSSENKPQLVIHLDSLSEWKNSTPQSTEVSTTIDPELIHEQKNKVCNIDEEFQESPTTDSIGGNDLQLGHDTSTIDDSHFLDSASLPTVWVVEEKSASHNYENMEEEIVWDEKATDQEKDEASIVSPDRSVQVISLAALACRTSPIGKDDDIPPPTEVVVRIEDAPHDEEQEEELKPATPSVPPKEEKEEETSKDVDTGITGSTTRSLITEEKRAEVFQSLPERKATAAEALKPTTRSQTRKAKFEQRQAMKKEKAQQREEIKSGKMTNAKSSATTLLGRRLPFKKGVERTKKKETFSFGFGKRSKKSMVKAQNEGFENFSFSEDQKEDSENFNVADDQKEEYGNINFSLEQKEGYENIHDFESEKQGHSETVKAKEAQKADDYENKNIVSVPVAGEENDDRPDDIKERMNSRVVDHPMALSPTTHEGRDTSEMTTTTTTPPSVIVPVVSTVGRKTVVPVDPPGVYPLPKVCCALVYVIYLSLGFNEGRLVIKHSHRLVVEMISHTTSLVVRSICFSDR